MRALLLHAWRDVRRRPARAALAFLGVALGVAALVAITISSRAAQDAYGRMYESLTGRAAVEVVAEGLSGFDPAIASRLAALEGVRAAVPVVLSPAALTAPGPRAAIVVLGMDAAQGAAVHDVRIVEGAGLGDADGAVLLASLGRAQGARVGGTVRLLTPTGPVQLRVVGLATATSLAAFPGGVALLPLATARRIFGLGDRVNAVQVVVADGADEEEVLARVRATLPTGLRAQRPAARGLIARSSLNSATQGLSAVSLMSLVAAVFVILNAFAMNLAERRRALATLRGLGATRTQVTAALVVEAGALGVAGTAAGIGAGVAGARLLSLGLERMLGVALPPPQPTWGAIALAAVVGPAATLCATILPARRAARRDPLRDLLGTPESSNPGVRRAAVAVGGALVLGVLAVARALALGRLSPAWIAPSMACGMLGGALVFPGLLPALRRATLALLAPVAGPAGRLGLRQVVRRPVHTTLSSTVLFLAVLTGVGMGNEILCGVRDVKDWADRALVEDYFVRATMPESGTMNAASIPEALGDELERLPGVDRVERIRFIPARSGREPVLVIAHTFPPGRPLALDLERTAPGTRPTEIGPDEAIVGTALAQRLRLSPGDTLEVSTLSGPRRLRVLATTTEYTAGGQALYVAWETAARAFGSRGVDAFMIVAAPGRRGEAGAALARVCARDGLLLQSNDDLKGLVDGMVGGVVGLLWVVLAVVFLVASLGVVNTLTTNVLEQTREIGVLRAIGMTRGQVGKMIAAEAVAMAVMGVLPGAIAGAGLSRLMNAAVEPVRGFPIEFRLAPGLLLGSMAAAIAVAVASAALPARRAARLPVMEALHHE